MIRSRSLPWLGKASNLATLTHVQVPARADGEEEIEVVVLDSESDFPKEETLPLPRWQQQEPQEYSQPPKEERIHRFSSFSERMLSRERSNLGLPRIPRQPEKAASPTRIVKVFSDASMGQECSKLTIKSFDEEDKVWAQTIPPRKFARRLSNPGATWWKGSSADTESTSTNPPVVTPPKPPSVDHTTTIELNKKRSFLRRTLSGTFGNKKNVVSDTDSMQANASQDMVPKPKSPTKQALLFLSGKENNSGSPPERRIIRRTTSDSRVDRELGIPSAVEYRTRSRDSGTSIPPKRMPRRNSEIPPYQSNRNQYASHHSVANSMGGRSQRFKDLASQSSKSSSNDRLVPQPRRAPSRNQPFDEYERTEYSHDATALSSVVPDSVMHDKDYTNRYPPQNRSYPMILDGRNSGPTQYQPPKSTTTKHRESLMERSRKDRDPVYDHLSNATPVHSNTQRPKPMQPRLAERTTYDRAPSPYSKSPQHSEHSGRGNSSESEASESYVSFSDYESQSSESSTSSGRPYSDEDEVEVRQSAFSLF